MLSESGGRVSAWRVGLPLVLQDQLSAIAQIYLQSSPVFGAVVLLCLYLSSPVLALGCLLGACSASAAAWMLAFPDDDRRQGLYSFNAALSGAGLCANYQYSSALVGWIVAACILTALLSRAAQRAGIPMLTSLFVGVMWLTLAVAPSLGLQPAAQVSGNCGLSALRYLFCVVGQVSFIGSAALGMLVWAVLARRHWHLAMWMLAGATLAWCVASAADMLPRWHGIVEQSSGMGMNSALTMLALASFGRPWPGQLAGATVSIVLCIAFGATGQPYFTVPFVLATWIVVGVSGWDDRRLKERRSAMTRSASACALEIACSRDAP